MILTELSKDFGVSYYCFKLTWKVETSLHFCVSEFRAGFREDVNLEFQKFIHAFREIFSDPDGIESDILLFQKPFDCNIDNVPIELQLKLIDLQENDLFNEKHREWKRVEFFDADDQF